MLGLGTADIGDDRIYGARHAGSMGLGMPAAVAQTDMRMGQVWCGHVYEDAAELKIFRTCVDTCARHEACLCE